MGNVINLFRWPVTVIIIAAIISHTLINNNNDRLTLNIFNKLFEIGISAENEADRTVRRALLSYLDGYKGPYLNDIGIFLLISTKKYVGPSDFTINQICSSVIYANREDLNQSIRRCNLGELAAINGALTYLKKIEFISETYLGNDPDKTPQYRLTPLGRASYSWLNLDALTDQKLHEKLGMLNIYLSGNLEFILANRK